MPKLTSPLESSTRKKIDQILLNLGWVIDEESPECNVFTERAKTKEQKQILKGKSPDYVLYESKTDNPIAIIEAKKSGQNLKDALEQAINYYAIPLNAPIIFVTDGTIIESYDLRSKSNLKNDDQLITEFISEKFLLRFYKEGSSIYSPEKVVHTKRELIKIFSKANDLLREDGIREGIERFTEFSNLLFLKLISELEKDRESNGEKRILEDKYCWEAFCKKSGDEMLDYINKIILPRLVDKYNHSGDVFESELQIKNPENLKQIVKELSALELLNVDSDIKGDAFEYFLKNSVTVGNDLGEYFTPRHIVKLIVDLLDPAYGERIYDPCCGTGGFLIEGFRHIKKKCKLTKETIEFIKEKTIYGRELTSTAKIAKMNMIIIGDGHTNIQQTDSLKHPLKEEFEIITTNFPFSQKTKYSSLYGFTTEDANPIFLKHVIDALKNGGRAGVVVPDGLLFDKNSEYIKLRKLLLENCNVIAVIQLDPFVFRPYTGQPTSILIFEKGKQTKKVWFFDVVNDGFKKTGAKKGRTAIKENDLPLLKELWIDKEDSEQSLSVDFETIKNNSYKLTYNTYKKRKLTNIPVKTIGEICEPPIIGGTPPKDDKRYWNGNNLWVKISDMKEMCIMETEEKISDLGVEKSSVKKIQPGTLLFSFKLTLGKVGLAGNELYTNEAIAALIPKDIKDLTLTKYLYYMLPTLDYSPFAQRAAKGFTLNSDSIVDIEVPYPSKEMRDKIVEECDKKELEKIKLVKMMEDIEIQKTELIQKYISN